MVRSLVSGIDPRRLACQQAKRQLQQGNSAELPRLAFLVMLGEQQRPWRVKGWLERPCWLKFLAGAACDRWP